MASTVAVQEPRAPEQTIEIGVCADQVALLDRVSAALEDGGLPASVRWDDLAQAKAGCKGEAIDVAIVAARRAEKPSLEIVSALVQTSSELRVVMVCERSAAGDIRKALDAGARGFVLVDDVDRVLVPVLRVVFAGQVSVPGMRGQEAGRQVLTSREKQILGLVVSGMTNGEIASRLYLAESTVKSHLSSSFAKLGVASRNEATALLLDPVRGRGLGMPAMTAAGTKKPA